MATFAQPGPQNHAAYFNFTLFDEEGKEISFSKNPEYRIRLGKTLYSYPNIPRDSLNIETYYGPDVHYYVKINDFSVKQVETVDLTNKPEAFEIQIIRGKEIMHLIPENAFGLKLKFIPGYYYFPPFAKEILIWPPVLSGNSKFMNIDQRHFIVSKAALDSINSWEKQDALEKEIAERFAANELVSTKNIEPSKQFGNNMNYRGFTSKLYPTKNKDEFIALASCDKHVLNRFFEYRSVCIFNKEKNTVYHITPKENLDQIHSINLFADTFNYVFYQIAGIRETVDSNCINRINKECAFESILFVSTDQGQTWKEDQNYSKMAKRYPNLKMDFLDRRYAVISTKVEKQTNNHWKKQAFFYLCEDGKIVDSMKSPIFKNYRSDYNYGFLLKNKDTALLGEWSISTSSQHAGNYFYPMAIQTNGKWEFNVDDNRQTLWSDNKSKAQFNNFQLVDEQKLVFEKSTFEVDRYTGVTDQLSNRKYCAVENENQVLLIYSENVWFTPNKGESWYFLPRYFDEVMSSGNLLVSFEDGKLVIYNTNTLIMGTYTFSVK